MNTRMEAAANLAMRFKFHYKGTIASLRWLLLLIGTVVLAVTSGCARKQIAAKTPAANGMVTRDNSYVDLQPGWQVRIIVPVMKPGSTAPSLTTGAVNGNTITLSAGDLMGYDTAHYVVTGKRGGGVKVRFVSAEETIGGKAVPLAAPGATAGAKAFSLPFELPQRSEHLRVIYLVRVSQADHNMAIAGARHMQVLDAFTKRLREDPNVCATRGEIFCTWVPAGVAVRTENP